MKPPEDWPTLMIEICPDLRCQFRLYVKEFEQYLPDYFNEAKKIKLPPFIDDNGNPYYLSFSVPLIEVFERRELIRNTLQRAVYFQNLGKIGGLR